VNFTNVLHANFCIKEFQAAFFNSQFGFEIFWHKNIGAKAAHKMLMKLTTVVNFNNKFMYNFNERTLQKHKKTV